MQNPNELTFPEHDDAPQFHVHLGGHTDSLTALRGNSGSPWKKIVVGAIVLGAGVFGFMRLTAPPEPGTAVIVTTPASNVGVALDRAPMVMQNSPIKLEKLAPNADHSVEISAEGFKTQTISFHIGEAEVKTIPAIAMEPQKVDTGFALDSKPSGATVLVDGVKLGVTPVRTLTLQPGKHSLRVENGFTHEPWEGSIEPTAGQVLELPAVELVALPKWKVKKAEAAARKQAALQAKQAKLQAKRGGASVN